MKKMISNIGKFEIITLILVLISFGISFYYYNQMPDRMVTHWGFNGEPNGYSSRAFGLFLVPVMLVIFAVIFFFIPRIDPMRKNVEGFKNYFRGFVILLLLIMMFVQMQMILWNIGIEINPNIYMPLLFGLMFIYLGFMLGKTKMNWFIGIRTPWTLSSEKVWDKTHKIGSKLFMISGVISMVGVLFPKYSIFFLIVPIIISSVYLMIYSYIEYKKEKQKK